MSALRVRERGAGRHDGAHGRVSRRSAAGRRRCPVRREDGGRGGGGEDASEGEGEDASPPGTGDAGRAGHLPVRDVRQDVRAAALPAQAQRHASHRSALRLRRLHGAVQDEDVPRRARALRARACARVPLHALRLHVARQRRHPGAPPAARAARRRVVRGVWTRVRRPRHAQQAPARARRTAAVRVPVRRLHVALQHGAHVPGAHARAHGAGRVPLLGLWIRVPAQAPPAAARDEHARDRAHDGARVEAARGERHHPRDGATAWWWRRRRDGDVRRRQTPAGFVSGTVLRAAVMPLDKGH